jgi:lipopolysaccharide export system protein LptA
MTTGVSRIESDTGRVQGLFQSSGQGGPPAIPGMSGLGGTPAPAPAPAGPANKQK